MTVPRDVYDFFIEPIRKEDQRIGSQFLQRYLRGPQSVWETLHDKLHAIPTIWSIDECPDALLIYLKWIVGWTSELDAVTRNLTNDELRRLISISGRLWKLRGTEDTIVDVMRFATGQRCLVWNWFDWRWLIDESGLEEARQGRDTWVLDAGEYESNLRIVDEGNLNKELVIELLKLMRATGERWDITYLAFLDQFLEDGDDTQWTKGPVICPSLVVADGKLSMTDDSLFEYTWTNSEAATWTTYMAYARLRGTSTTGSPGTGYGFAFYFTDVNNYYYLKCVPVDKRVYLYRLKTGTPTLLYTIQLDLQPFHDNVWYGYRVSITDESGDKRIRVYIDGMEWCDHLDTNPLSQGTIAIFHEVGETVECSDVEVVDLPVEDDYVDINS